MQLLQCEFPDPYLGITPRLQFKLLFKVLLCAQRPNRAPCVFSADSELQYWTYIQDWCVKWLDPIRINSKELVWSRPSFSSDLRLNPNRVPLTLWAQCYSEINEDYFQTWTGLQTWCFVFEFLSACYFLTNFSSVRRNDMKFVLTVLHMLLVSKACCCSYLKNTFIAC